MNKTWYILLFFVCFKTIFAQQIQINLIAPVGNPSTNCVEINNNGTAPLVNFIWSAATGMSQNSIVYYKVQIYNSGTLQVPSSLIYESMATTQTNLTILLAAPLFVKSISNSVVKYFWKVVAVGIRPEMPVELATSDVACFTFKNNINDRKDQTYIELSKQLEGEIHKYKLGDLMGVKVNQEYSNSLMLFEIFKSGEINPVLVDYNDYLYKGENLVKIPLSSLQTGNYYLRYQDQSKQFWYALIEIN